MPNYLLSYTENTVFILLTQTPVAYTGSALPATAQVASQKATHLAKRLNRGDVGEKAFRFRNLGTMTYLGNWTAIHQSNADELKGWAAWVLWRTAYLTRSMSIRNKISKQSP